MSIFPIEPKVGETVLSFAQRRYERQKEYYEGWGNIFMQSWERLPPDTKKHWMDTTREIMDQKK